MDQLECDNPVVLGGDWNLVLEHERDSYNYRRLNNARAQRGVLDMIKKFNLVDVFRERSPTLKRYTWRVKNPSLKQARLDFFLVSTSINEKVIGCDIKPWYRTESATAKMLKSLVHNALLEILDKQAHLTGQLTECLVDHPPWFLSRARLTFSASSKTGATDGGWQTGARGYLDRIAPSIWCLSCDSSKAARHGQLGISCAV